MPWLVGFRIYRGTLTAATDWGSAVERNQLRPPLQAAARPLFHAANTTRLTFPFAV
jgi:erythromycin esterase-like protein